MKTLLLLLALSMVGCGKRDPNPPRRFKTVYVDRSLEDECSVRVVEDTQTGCQYLKVCNGITAMPNTCRGAVKP